MAKGGGGSNTFKQTPDNLRSEDTFEGVLGLCIGPIKGPTHGLKSIKLDGTAVENASGELNFKDFIVTTADGDPVKHPQNVTLKLGAGAAPSSVNVALTNTNVAAGTGSPGPWITRTLSNTGPNFIDLRFIVSQLYRQDKKGIYNETMSLEIQMKPSALSTWINPILNTPSGGYSESGITIDEGYGNYTTYVPRAYYNGAGTAWLPGPTNYVINGKTSSPSVYELRIAVPNAGAYTATTWDIRVRLLERASYDNGSSTDNIQEKRTVAWESMARRSVGPAVRQGLGLPERRAGDHWRVRHQAGEGAAGYRVQPYHARLYGDGVGWLVDHGLHHRSCVDHQRRDLRQLVGSRSARARLLPQQVGRAGSIQVVQRTRLRW
jgi:hypothetical protein